MISDRRRNKKLPKESMEKLLNREQLSTLLQSQQFGWRLWFIRKPLFPDSLPVLYNATHNQLGILEPDGYINTDVKTKVRSDQNRHGDLKLVLQVAKTSDRNDPQERRMNKVFVREDLEALLNPHQLRTLRDMESSGWRLLFVRTSLFQAPVIVITSSAGEIFATLEHDGQLNLTPDLCLRQNDWPIEIAKHNIYR